MSKCRLCNVDHDAIKVRMSRLVKIATDALDESDMLRAVNDSLLNEVETYGREGRDTLPTADPDGDAGLAIRRDAPGAR